MWRTGSTAGGDFPEPVPTPLQEGLEGGLSLHSWKKRGCNLLCSGYKLKIFIFICWLTCDVQRGAWIDE